MATSIVRVRCGHEGCKEFARFEAFDRKHAIQIDKDHGNGKWRCYRHHKPEQLLAMDNLRTEATAEIIEVFSNNGVFIGKYFGSMAMLSGLGYRIIAEDWPVGTKLRVTAEVILPENMTP